LVLVVLRVLVTETLEEILRFLVLFHQEVEVDQQYQTMVELLKMVVLEPEEQLMLVETVALVAQVFLDKAQTVD